VVTRSLGVRRLDPVEEVVQAALVQALSAMSVREFVSLHANEFGGR